MSHKIRRPQLTHFLAIPLYTALSAHQLTNSLSRFAAEVTAGSSQSKATTSEKPDGVSSIAAPTTHHHHAFGASSSTSATTTRGPLMTIPPKAIRPASTLHLTLGVMSLTSPSQIQAAKALLRCLDLNSILAAAAVVAEPSGFTPELESARISPPPLAASQLSKGRELLNENKRLEKPGDRSISPPVRRPQQEHLPETISEPDSRPPPPSSAPGISATEISANFDPESLSNATQPALILSLHGLKPMQALHATTVLYATPEDSTNRLYPLCQALRRKFVDAGVMLPEDRELKLHATLVNTIYASKSGGGGGRGSGRGGKGAKQKRIHVDATELVERWGEEVWADKIRADTLVIYKMGAKMGEDGLEKYEVVEAVQMP